MKKLLLITVVMLVLAACGNGDDGDAIENPTIGISMPTQGSERWIEDGNNIVSLLEDRGYDTDLQYAEDVVENQLSQIENMISQGVDILIIASVDGEALTDVLDQAQNMDIPVIAYDRLIMNHEHVDYYATFDNFGVGELQGQYIVDALDLEDGDGGPYNIELFGGSPDDNNAYFFWDGAMSILEPYIESEDLVVQSGQTDFSQAATLRWDGSEAQSRLDNILSSYYSDESLDAILSPYDGISLASISSLESAGYGSDDRPLPIITGQDAYVATAQSILEGEQTQTVFKDTRDLADRAINMVEAIVEGEEPELNDTESYDNNSKVVPSYLEQPVSVDIDNIEEELFESGYIERDEVE
ncbi:multiple monosaccharide-binding protein [Pelagirhabdus alkalitolerans]|uniref:Multiple monosaccharide-binding protein n=1 Tax=Pelagirhabdus alkalitolerans TaxID=1612202 RepID=A0A1G6GKA8_9BACI|nr:multiple monosaccharide ABC transporter substrate-binding protein [Pelagirhabdus alkalitolerans]SDB82380.1 multiple monosaccharide-binding protein [Pelagirhabdus alkalitolerans]